MQEANFPREHSMDNEWMNSGSCRELPPSTFFPSDGTGVIVAQQICENCPVKVACLEHALANRIDHGVWGGTSERQRRRLLKSSRIDVAAESRSATAVA